MEDVILVKLGGFVASIVLVMLIGFKKVNYNINLKKQDIIIWSFFDIIFVMIISELFFSLIPDLLIYYKIIHPTIIIWLCALIMPSLSSILIIWYIFNYKYHIKINSTLKIIGEKPKSSLYFGIQWGMFVGLWWLLQLYCRANLSTSRIQQMSNALLSSTPYLFVIDSLIGIIICPIAEEILYRGLIYSAFKQKLSKKQAMFWSAVTWAIGHESGFLWTILLGYILAKIYNQQNSLVPCIIIHACTNMVVYISILYFYYHSIGIITLSCENFHVIFAGSLLLIFVLLIWRRKAQPR